MFAALYFSMHSDWKPIVQLKREMEEKILPIFSSTKIFDLAFIAFFAGVGEEIFFRGWMQAVLMERSGVLIGILITSLIFGLLHYLSTVYAIYAFITGIYLGVIYYVSGNLYIVMAIHALYDFVALAYLFKRKLYH
jgi:membrane protease YdiL (CAAX protease family)